jgi:hypothetical protein
VYESSADNVHPKMATQLQRKLGDYRTLGHTSGLFRKTRMQLYDPLAVTQACNYDGYKCEETSGSLIQLRNALEHHSDRRIEMREERLHVAIPVCDEMGKRGFGRRTSVVKGSRIRCAHADDAIVNGKYIMNYCPMKRNVRGHLAFRAYIDIDIVNCHPVIAMQLFQKSLFACPLLTEYVFNRNEILETIMKATGCDYRDVKDLMLAVANDGNVSSWAANHQVDPRDVPKWVFNFAMEMVRNRDRLLKTEEYKRILQIAISEKKKHPERSAFAWILQDWERRIMECCVIYAEHIDKFSVDVIIHDGWMVRIESRIIAEENLKRWAGFAMNIPVIRVSLTQKQNDRLGRTGRLAI